ncbi:hypothetical protein [Nonomuraea rhizosphaerae]|uniref:hypothetical protein n=1 Tax=Nonomuraea rhizosphaerae TaxID=2665663 RepID=UPI001C5DB08B|nr:hypothetical protein [Nonomuraea rhizosphaerae]
MTTIVSDPTHADRVVYAVAALAADYQMAQGGDLLARAVRAALLVARVDLPLDQVAAEADRLIEQARCEQMADEHGEHTAAVAS